MDRLRDIVGSTWFRRGVLGLYVGFVALTIAVYMGVSWLQVHTAAYVRGSPTLERDRPNAVRGAIMNVTKGTFRRNVDVGLFLLEPGDRRGTDADGRSTRNKTGNFDGALLTTLRPNRSGVFQHSLQVPDSAEPGPYDLAIRVQGPGFEPFEAFRRVEVREEKAEEVRWPEKTSRIENEKRRENLESGPVESQSGAIAIDVLPLDAELPRGLDTQVYLRTYDRKTGEPVRAEVEFEEVEGSGRWGGGDSSVPEAVQTDGLGLAEIPVRPVGGQRWRLRAEALKPAMEGDAEGDTEGGPADVPPAGEATVRLHTVATQVAVTLERPMIGDLRRVQGSIQSLFTSGELLVDLYRGEDWLKAREVALDGRTASVRLQVPEPTGDAWLYRLQLARGFYDVGANWESQYIVDRSALEREGDRGGLARVAAFVAEHRDDPYFEYLADREPADWTSGGSIDRERWLRAFLEAVPRHFSRPGTLFNTREKDREALAEWRRDVHGDLMVVIALALAGGLAVLAYVVLVGFLRHREHRENLREVDAELATEQFDGAGEGESSAEVSAAAGGRWAWLRDGLLAFVALVTFAMFAVGILFLLSYM